MSRTMWFVTYFYALICLYGAAREGEVMWSVPIILFLFVWPYVLWNDMREVTND